MFQFECDSVPKNLILSHTVAVSVPRCRLRVPKRGVSRVWPQSKNREHDHNVCSVETTSVEATAYDAVAADIDGGEGGLNARGIIA